ncbi:MAG: MarR family winged helix-turn-helix transcriptional regulator [Bacteroidia bacterium]
MTNSSNLDSLLLQFINKMNARRSSLLEGYGVTESDIAIIRYLNANEVQKMKELGEQFDLKFSTLTSTIDRLERNRLVKRRNSKDDRRVVFVQISQRGQQLLVDVEELYQKLAGEFEGKLDEQSTAALTDLLNGIVSA